jgi:hypothetical protein
MTATTSAPPAVQRAAAAAVKPPQPRRTRPLLVLAGVLVSIICALLAAALVRAAGQATPVLAVTRDIPQGEKITDGDLAVVQIQTPPPLTPVRADQRAAVVGHYAAVPLVAGALLVDGHVTDEPVPGPGNALVPVSVKAGKMPARALTAGDKLNLVVVPDPRAATAGADEQGSTPLAPPVTFEGTVHAVSAPAPNGDVVVDVIVNAGDAPTIAGLNAQDRLAITVTAG